MMDILDYFDAYVKCGLQPLPLHPGTKIPMIGDWQANWSVGRYRELFMVTPNLNIGILLGNVIDVEGDDQFANERIIELTRNTPHPMFRSNKSVHHLFLSPDPTITVCKIGMIEFRGHRHQSVIPPSVHESGVKYAWLKDSAFPPPPMPRHLIEFLYSNKKQIQHAKRSRSRKKSNHIVTTCNKCRIKTFIHKKRLLLEVQAFATLGSKWLCHKCRTVDVRAICRKINDQRDHA